MSNWKTRTELMLGSDELKHLENAHILVVGAGGVGGIASEMLARAGIGEMTLVDGDIVEDSNRNRQIAALVSTVGLPKVEVMKNRILDINPDIKIHTHNTFIRDELTGQLLDSAKFDCVLDCIDSISPKVHLIALCHEKSIPLVSSMGSGARLNPELVRTVDISKTSMCALARVVRKRLKKMGIEKGVRVVFSPEAAPPGAVTTDLEKQLQNKCSITGTISFMPAVFGCHCAGAVIKTILENAAGKDVADV